MNRKFQTVPWELLWFQETYTLGLSNLIQTTLHPGRLEEKQAFSDLPSKICWSRNQKVRRILAAFTTCSWNNQRPWASKCESRLTRVFANTLESGVKITQSHKMSYLILVTVVFGNWRVVFGNWRWYSETRILTDLVHLICGSCVKQLAAFRELYLLQYRHVLPNK
jgi:hypothetical protein